MDLCWFAIVDKADNGQRPLGDDEAKALGRFLGATPGLSAASVHLPGQANDPLLPDGSPPAAVLQLYFQRIDALEAALSPTGYLQALPEQAALARLGAREVTQQAMLVRRYAGQPAPPQPAGAEPACTYQVAYEGPAQDLNAWLSDYLEGHVPLMTRLPGVRQVDIYTRIDWCSALPWRRANHMQRNQVVFDDRAALDAALQSPLRLQMREHFRQLPPFTGRVTHHAMRSFSLRRPENQSP